MELHQLRYFIAVAESGSFSRAAAQCGVAQPTLSQQIQRLESGLGQRLFDRLGRSIAITAAGEALLPHAKRILAEVRQVEGEMLTEPQAQRLSIGAIPTMAPYLLPPAIKRFRKSHPHCCLTVREALTEQLLDALANCEIDLALMSAPIDHELIDLEIIGSEPLLVAAPRDFRCKQNVVTLASLRNQPAIVLHEMHCLGRQIEEFCALRKIERRIICRSTQLATALRLVAAGIGISIVPESCANSEPAMGCRFLPIARLVPSREIAIAWRTGRSRSPAAKAMAVILTAMCGSAGRAADDEALPRNRKRAAGA